MEYRTVRRYQGRVKAVVFDWAGTTVDCGCISPTNTFRQIFEEEGVTISEYEARLFIGIHKRVHIVKLLELGRVGELWESVKGGPPTEADIDRMYKRFSVVQEKDIANFAKPIAGVVETVAGLQSEGIKIGSCTGFASNIVAVLKEVAGGYGYKPDAYVAADEVPAARPLPHMVWLNAIRLNVHPIEAIVKVDDTVDGVREGLSAGCWSVGVAKTSCLGGGPRVVIEGNYVGLSESDLSALSPAGLDKLLIPAREKLSEAGAHYVIDSVADIAPVIQDINRRLRDGGRP